MIAFVYRCAPVRVMSIGLIAGLSVVSQARGAGGPVLYVDDDGPARGGDGASWATALPDLQAALDMAAEPGSGVSEIRVGQGRYVPTKRTEPGDPRSATFQLLNAVALRGGYAGIGADDPDARDFEKFETILSGDLSGDDLPGFVNNGENVLHVLIGSGTDSTSVLDGFVITAGNANIVAKAPGTTHYGGGLLNVQGSPTIVCCRFVFNWAVFGGGLYNREGSEPVVDRCTFVGNYAADRGAAIRHYGYEGGDIAITDCTFDQNESATAVVLISFSPFATITGCSFTGNTAGGMVANVVDLHVENCTFTNNTSPVGGGLAVDVDGSAIIRGCQFLANDGGFAGGGAKITGNVTVQDCAFRDNVSSWIGGGAFFGETVQVINCTFTGNESDDGGGCVTSGLLTLRNCSIVGNAGGGVSVISAGTLLAQNSIIWNNSPYQVGVHDGEPPPPPGLTDPITALYSNIQGGWTGAGSNNIDADPMFLQPGCDDLRLEIGSPCINAGSNALVPPGMLTDLAGNPRIQNGTVDMGAYEGGYEPVIPMACADDLDAGESAVLNPDGVPGMLNGTRAVITNLSETDNAYATATELVENIHGGAGGFNEMGLMISLETSLAPGQLFMRVSVAFDANDLGVIDPLLLDLTHFDAAANAWSLAAIHNTQNSPGFEGPLGDRHITIGGPPGSAFNFELGDYGVYWDPELEKGFVWANVDHASDFAFGVPLPQCPADVDIPSNGIVNALDLVAVLDAWGLAPPGSFADLDQNGDVNADDLIGVIEGWGPCQ